MSLQYVELESFPEKRHIVKHVGKGKTKKGNGALTVCGRPFGMDDAVIFSQPSSSLGDKAPAPICGGCNGLDDAKPATPLRLEQLDVDSIERSPLNHRTRFVGIDELGVDIKANGLRVPIKVRPTPADAKSNKPWQLVYGERRWRAAKSADVEKLPALIADLTDLEVIKEQLVENVSRSDVHPIEEAEGYQQLLADHGYSVEQIASETGKSRTAIYNRLKLRDLPKSARDACFEGKLSMSVAELIARIPVAALREEAARDIVRGREQDRYELSETFDRLTEEIAEDLDDADDYRDRVEPREGIQIEDAEMVPLSTREASALIKRRYMLRLELAPFDIKDDAMPGGACTSCVHRTGNQPDLFGDVSSADVCTNPPCFAEKRAVATERKIQATKAAGLEVLPAKKASEIFAHDGSQVYSSPYLDLNEEADWQYQEPKGRERTKKTWRQVLGKAAPTPIVALDERGNAHELVVKKEATKSLDKAGKTPKEAKQYDKERAASSDREKGEREKQEIKRETATRALAILADAEFANFEVVRWIAECVIRQASMDAQNLVVKRRGLVVSGSGYGRDLKEKPLLKFAKDSKNQGELEGLVVELLAAESAATNYHVGYGTNLAAAAKPFGLDLAKLKKSVEADRKAKSEKAKRIDKAQAKVDVEVAKIQKAAKKKGRK